MLLQSDREIRGRDMSNLYSYKQLPRIDSDDHGISSQLMMHDEEIKDMINNSGVANIIEMRRNMNFENMDEPDFHKNNKSICMKLLPTLAARTKLTPDELYAYYYFKLDQVKPFDSSNRDHEVSNQLSVNNNNNKQSLSRTFWSLSIRF